MIFTEKNGNLIIMADTKERETLREDGNDIHTDDYMYEFFEDFIANSEWDWILPEDNGDLTDAPILGIEGEPDRRYGFMDYQRESVLGRLHETGKCIFIGAS